jgi:NAD(P)-dependent dehydrogenase (short-subunit alcohol dehydrogenase family)
LVAIFHIKKGVNHIAHHFWTRTLLPNMRPWGRIVTVSSLAHGKVRNLEVDDLNYSGRRYCPYGAYCQSKLSNILFSKALQDRISSESMCSILSLSVHPGRVLTNLWKAQQPGGDLLLHAVSEYISSKSPEQGASSIVYCCLADASHFKQGDFIVDCNSNTPSEIAMNKQIRNRLWDATEKMIQDSGFHLPTALV